MKRREFLMAGAGVSLLGAAASGAGGPAVIDTHIHLWDTNRPGGVAWPPVTDTLLYRPVLPAEFKTLTRPHGVTGAIIIEASPQLEDNLWVLDLMKDEPIFVGYIGHLSPGTDTFRRNLARFAKNPLFRGIRVGGAELVSGVSKPAFLDDLARLADAGLTLDALGNASMVAPLTTIAGKLRNLRIAIDHMPVEPTGWTTDTMRELAGHTQVFCKVSTVLKRVNGKVSDDPAVYKTSLDELWEMFGADRVMYGSNWPVSLNLAPYATVFNVVKGYVTQRGGTDAARYFGANSKACYGWVERG